MFSRISALALAFIMAACAAEQGNGVAGSETRPVGEFNELEINTVHAHVIVDPQMQGESRIELEGDENLVRQVRTRVEDHRLVVDTGHEDVDPRLPLRFAVRTRALTDIRATGGSVINVELRTNTTLKVRAAGGAMIVATGQVPRLEADLAGSARLSAKELVAHTVDLTSAGGAFAAVCATDRLEVDLAGDSTADYYCHPRAIDRDVEDGAHLNAR